MASDRVAGDGDSGDPVAGGVAGGRDPWLDNAKLALVTLVVVGHAWTLLPSAFVPDRLYDHLYLWHIPAFVVVTGYLSRGFTYSPRHLRRLVTTVAVPYLVAEGLMAAFRIHVGGEELARLWINPHWPMWYLAVLLVWRLATPALRRLRHALPLAVLVSLLGGLVGIDVLDLSRAMGLLPFFTLGLLAEPRHLEWLRRPGMRRVGLWLLFAGFAVAHLVEEQLGTRWLYWQVPYAELSTRWFEGIGIRAFLLVASTALALSVLAWIPGRDGWFTRLGTASLVIYVFHGFPIRAAEYAGFEAWAAGHVTAALMLLTLVAVTMALLLASPPISRILGRVVAPVR